MPGGQGGKCFLSMILAEREGFSSVPRLKSLQSLEIQRFPECFRGFSKINSVGEFIRTIDG